MARKPPAGKGIQASKPSGIQQAIAARFEHTFQHALLGVGALLVVLGAAAGALSVGQLASVETPFDALSQGFTQAFFALFAGVVTGAGTALMLDGLVLGLRGSRAHVAACLLLALLAMLAAFFAVARAGESTFAGLIVFFAGISASAALFLSAAVFWFSSALHSFLSQREDEIE